MKTVIALCLAVMLSGCSATLETINVALTDRPNPVTKQMLYNLEQSLVVATTGLLVYKRLCIKKAIDQSCRGTVEYLQGYTRQAQPVLVNLRKFVKEKDEVNAIDAYRTLKQIVDDLNRQTPTITAATEGSVP